MSNGELPGQKLDEDEGSALDRLTENLKI